MNGKMNFDPMTGQPLNNNFNTDPNYQQKNESSVNETNPEVPIMQSINVNENTPQVNIQQEMQSIPTVDQSTQNFLNNSQVNNELKPDENKEKKNIWIVIAIFVTILAAVLFLFPLLFNAFE